MVIEITLCSLDGSLFVNSYLVRKFLVHLEVVNFSYLKGDVHNALLQSCTLTISIHSRLTLRYLILRTNALM